MQKNKHIWTSLIVGLVIAGGAVASNVTVPNTFLPSTPARASEVNANFAAVSTAVNDNFSLIGALETALSALVARVTSAENAITALTPRVDAVEQSQLAHVPLVAVQSAVDIQAGGGSWTAVPGVSLSFTTTKASTPILMTATGAMAAVGGSGWLRCGVRFVIDGDVVPGTDPNMGNLAMSPGQTEASAAEFLPFTAMEKHAVGPGTHAVALQMTRVEVAGSTSTGNCAIFRWFFSRAKLVVQQL